jgi:hypothetical protein
MGLEERVIDIQGHKGAEVQWLTRTNKLRTAEEKKIYSDGEENS